MKYELDEDSASEITQLLARSENGASGALSLAVERLYPELRRLAGFQMGRGRAMTLSATDVLHEAYEKLSNYQGSYANRAHFMAVASTAMRQVIIDYARSKSASKRGGNLQAVDLDQTQVVVQEQATELLLVDELLQRLSDHDERSAKVFECRFFGGMTDKETSEALGIPERTVQRAWMEAKRFMTNLWQGESG